MKVKKKKKRTTAASGPRGECLFCDYRPPEEDSEYCKLCNFVMPIPWLKNPGMHSRERQWAFFFIRYIDLLGKL